jgi:hypothetical protein
MYVLALFWEIVMKVVLMFFVFLAMCIPAYSQQDVNGDPDIFLPKDFMSEGFCVCDPFSDVPQLMIMYIDSDTGLPSYMLLTISFGGKEDPPEGPVTTPPPLGYWWKPSVPTESGTDYWKITGTINGQPFELNMQQYMSQGLHPEDKCNKAAAAVNYASDNHTSGKDPVTAGVNGETGRVEVTPNAGCTIDSSELQNGSKQTDDSTGEIPQPGPEPAKSSWTYKVFAASFDGIPSGINSADACSHAALGVGPYKLSTYIEPGESHRKILKRFKSALGSMGIKSMLGIDQYGGWHLLCMNPCTSVPYSCDDSGVSVRIILTRVGSPISGGQTLKFGRFKIKVVDPDEAMPHYIWK